MQLTRMTRTAGWLAVAGLLGAALIAPAATLAVTGPEVVPTQHEGNITSCPAGQGSTIYVDANTTSGSANGVTVSIDYDATSKSLDFTATGGVVWHAFIKGGNDYNHYDYTPLSGVAADDGLVAPDNASGGPAGLSHGIFCVVPTTTTTTSTDTTSTETTSTETTTTDTTSTETTSTETTQTTTTDTPDGSVEAETGTPDVTPPSTDVGPTAGGSGPTGGTWSLLLVAMAGLLAAVLLLTPATAPRKR